MNSQRIANSLVSRLVLIGIAIVLVGTLVRYFVLTDFLRKNLTAVVSSQQEALAGYIANDIDYKIHERQAMLKKLAQTLPLDLLQRPEQLRAWLGARHELQPLFSQGLFLTDATGVTLIDYPRRAQRPGVSYGDRDYIRAALAGEPAIGRPLIDRVEKVPVLPMAAPVKGSDGKVRGVLVGSTALAAPGFLDLLQQSRIGTSGGFLLISPRDKLFVAASKPDMVLKPTPPEGVNLLHDRAMAGYRGSGITINANGIEELSAMASVPSTGWFVVARLPTAEGFASIAKMQHLIINGSAGVIFTILLLMSSALIVIFRPLLRAADQADRMTRGELPLKPLPVVRDDEVGHLTAAFNRLLVKLQGSQLELTRMAHHDPLTSLPNRFLLADRMNQVQARAQRNGTRLALLFLDLDGFKPINDTLGHEAGDEALIEVVRRLAAIVREADTLARIGGDEFVVLISDLDQIESLAIDAACAVAAKCIEALVQPLTLKGEARSLGVSIGIAIDDGHRSSDELMILADGAMYKAKQSGGRRYILADGHDQSDLTK